MLNNKTKRLGPIIILLITIAILTTCKKTPEFPSSNKIEIGETTVDSLGYFGIKLSTMISGIISNNIENMGYCWNTDGQPTLDDNVIIANYNDSIIIATLSGLSANQKYIIKPYVITTHNTLYGNEIITNTLATSKPLVTTGEVVDITTNSAVSGGTNDNGGLTLSQRGVCWNATGNPTLENNLEFTTVDSGIGAFVSQFTNLSENTTYYISAYATNEKGTGYGGIRSFSTLTITTPEVNTSDPSDITTNSAVCGGDVTSSGNGTVTSRGVCWNKTGKPTLENNLGITVDGSGTGTFTSNIADLQLNVNYHIRAYAINEKGTAYGQSVQVTTHIPFVPLIDCSSLEGVLSYYRDLSYPQEGEWEVGTDGYNGNCWRTPSSVLEGFVEFQQYFPSSGYLKFWFNTFDAGSPNYDPKVYVDDIELPDVVMIGGGNSLGISSRSKQKVSRKVHISLKYHLVRGV